MFQNIKSRLALPGQTSPQAAPASPTSNPPARRAPRSIVDEGEAVTEKGSRQISLEDYEQLQKTLARYKNRLGDLVQAYKTLQKEKQALEQSLQALHSGPESGTANGDAEGSSADSGSADGQGSSDEQRRLATLGQAVATLTKEKAALETAYLEEKRRLQQQHKEALLDRDRCAAELSSVSERLAAAQQELDDAAQRRADGGTVQLGALQRALDDERSRVQRLDGDIAAIEATWAQRLAQRDAEVTRLKMELEDMMELHGELEARRVAGDQQASKLEQELSAVRTELEDARRMQADLERQLAIAAMHEPANDVSCEAAATATATATTAPESSVAEAEAPRATDVALPAQQQGLGDEAAKVSDDDAVRQRAEELAHERVRVHEARAAAAEEKCLQLRSACDALRRDMRAMQQEHQAQLSQLQDQVVANRERALLLMEDKERELKELRALLADGNASKSITPPPAPRGDPITTMEGGEPLLHQVQMQLARDRELAAAVTARAMLKEQLDNAEIQSEAQQRHLKQLTAEMEALRRAEKRESLNMEYLKNVMVKYFEAPPGQEQHLVRAVCALLQFTPEETDRVLNGPVAARGPRPTRYR